MSQRFVARVSRIKILGLIALAIIGTAGAAFVALSPQFEVRPIAQLAGWVGMIFAPLCALIAIRQLFRTDPAMEIGPEGILWRRWSETVIPWDAFTRAEAVQMHRQKMLSLWLVDPAAYRSTKLLGRLAGANGAMGFGDIVLTAQGLDRSFDQMAGAVHDHAPHLFQR